MRVLYLHPVAVFGGATKSLRELLCAVGSDVIHGFAIAPDGPGAVALTEAGVKVLTVNGLSQWDNTLYGHYRNWRWLILLREFAYLPGTIAALLRSRAHGPYTLIHCNEITLLPVGILAKWLLNSPLVVHVRSVQRPETSAWVARAFMLSLRRFADRVIAIDAAVRRSLPSDICVEIIHNGLQVPVVQSPAIENSSETRPFTIGIIGVLARSKGISELLKATRLLRERNVYIKVLIAGENPRKLRGIKGWGLKALNLSQDVRAELDDYVRTQGLEKQVEFLGFVSDIGGFYRRIDLLCFPSHLDAPGRPVFEAALHRLPAVVAMKDPTDDVVEHGITGLCIPNADPINIANAIAALAQDRQATRRMGEVAFVKALAKFDIRVAAGKLLRLYGELGATASK